MEHCPVANLDAFAREFIALCHQQSNAPCMYVNCGRDYVWHVLRGLYANVRTTRPARMPKRQSP